MENIVKEIKVAEYFSTIVDLISDVKVDQLIVAIRLDIRYNGSPKEIFIKFLPSIGHK